MYQLQRHYQLRFFPFFYSLQSRIYSRGGKATPALAAGGLQRRKDPRISGHSGRKGIQATSLLSYYQILSVNVLLYVETCINYST